jgi:hypothetical protein
MTNGKSAASTCGVEEQTDEREIHRIVTIGVWSPIGNEQSHATVRNRWWIRRGRTKR